MKIRHALSSLLIFGFATSAGAQTLGSSATPPQTHTPTVEEAIIPETGEADITTPNEAVVPGTVQGNQQPGFPRDAVPRTTEQERAGEDTVSPDIIPDRRFETFDSDTRGTPEMEPMPQRDETGGGTIGLPPGGYGIGVPGG